MDRQQFRTISTIQNNLQSLKLSIHQTQQLPILSLLSWKLLWKILFWKRFFDLWNLHFDKYSLFACCLPVCWANFSNLTVFTFSAYLLPLYQQKIPRACKKYQKRIQPDSTSKLHLAVHVFPNFFVRTTIFRFFSLLVIILNCTNVGIVYLFWKYHVMDLMGKVLCKECWLHFCAATFNYLKRRKSFLFI